MGQYRNESPIYKYNFSENLGINYDLSTAIGDYDTSGIVIDFYNNEYLPLTVAQVHLIDLLT